jgi:hypothetical protein
MPVPLGVIIWAHGADAWVLATANGGAAYPAFLIVTSAAQFDFDDRAYAPSRLAEISSVKTAFTPIGS